MEPRYFLSHGIQPCFVHTTLFCCSAHNAFVHDPRRHQTDMSTTPFVTEQQSELLWNLALSQMFDHSVSADNRLFTIMWNRNSHTTASFTWCSQ
mgnify:CR=1 FL=1